MELVHITLLCRAVTYHAVLHILQPREIFQNGLVIKSSFNFSFSHYLVQSSHPSTHTHTHYKFSDRVEKWILGVPNDCGGDYDIIVKKRQTDVWIVLFFSAGYILNSILVILTF